MAATNANFTVLRAALAANVPVLMWGEPGIGKTAIVENLTAMDGMDLEVVIGSVRDQTDFNGLPVVRDDGTVTRSPDDWVHSVLKAKRPIVMLDELSCSNPSVQAAMLRVVRERVVGQVTLPANLRMVAAANEADVAADGFELAAPVANRFLHLQWELDRDRYFEGMLSGFDTVVPTDADCRIIRNPDDDRRAAKRMQVVSFLMAKPALAQAQPTDPTKAGKAWPSSRTWNYLADVLAHLPDGDTGAILVAAEGLVGKGAAVEFVTYMKHYDLPTPEQVLDDPSIVNWKDRPDRVYTILAGVSGYTLAKGTKSAWNAAMKLMGAAADAGRADAAASTVSKLYAGRPKGATPPKGVLTAFLPTLVAAGLIDPDTIPQAA